MLEPVVVPFLPLFPPFYEEEQIICQEKEILTSCPSIVLRCFDASAGSRHFLTPIADVLFLV